MIEVDISEHEGEWKAVHKKARENLAGRIYSESLLEAVENIVSND